VTTPLHALNGDFDIQQASTRREELLALVTAHQQDAPGADLRLDLAGVTGCDSSGVQLLLAARHTLQPFGATLRIVQASAVLRDVLLTYGLQSLLAEPATNVPHGTAA
jgi:anti-anti-sigma factor